MTARCRRLQEVAALLTPDEWTALTAAFNAGLARGWAANGTITSEAALGHELAWARSAVVLGYDGCVNLLVKLAEVIAAVEAARPVEGR